MNLGDREILELNELCGALVDGRLTELQRARLSQLLHDSEAARRFYVRAMNESASLHSYASEMHAEGPEHAASPRRAVHFGWWMLGSLAAAASLAVAVWWPGGKGRNTEPGGARAGQFVARVTAAKDPHWTKRSSGLLPGTHLRRGQQLELTSGFAEITFDSGARVVIEGTATLEINSAWDTTLHRGTLKAIVPPEAIGFRVSNPVVEVVDLGTEFTMIADGKGSADVLVLKGEVEAAPRMTGEQETILLRAKDSRRFAESGISAVANRDEKFARFAQPRKSRSGKQRGRYDHGRRCEHAAVRCERCVSRASGESARARAPARRETLCARTFPWNLRTGGAHGELLGEGAGGCAVV
jgi:hypothetical protein